MNMEAVSKHWHLKEQELVLNGVEVSLFSQILIKAIYIIQVLLSQISKSAQVMHWNRKPQIGSTPQWLHEIYSCLMFS